MKKFTITSFKKAGRLGALLTLTAALSAPSFAQTWERVYATGQTSGGTLSTISGATNAVGTNLDDYSSLSFILLGSSWQKLTFADAPGTNPVHVKIGKAAGTISALTTITIDALNASDGVVATKSIGGLLGLLNGEDEMDIVLQGTAINPVSSIRVTYTGVALGSPLRVFAAYYDETATTDINCNTAVDVISGSTGGIATALTAITDVDNATDGDETSYATMNALVSALNTTHITALYSALSKDGDSVRVVLEDPAGLLDVGLISSRMTIQTFNGNTATTISDDAALLSLRLLPGSSDLQELVIETETPFDRIQVSIGGLATVLTDLRVYEIGKRIPAPTVTTDTTKIYAGVGTMPTLVANAFDGDDEVVWYATSTPSGSPLYTGSSYTLTTSPSASQSFYAFTSRNGCVETSIPSEAYVMVRPVTINAPADADAEFTPGEPYSFTITTTVGEDGGVPDFTYYLPEEDPHATGMSIMATGIPPGMSLAADGTLSGTPDPSPEPDFTFTVNVYDALDNPVALGAPVMLINAAPLPVSFVSFTAKAMQNNTALLQWATASEDNNSHFDIERSADTRNFVKVGAIEGNGTTTESHAYTFSDKVQEGTAVVYYRIRQVDFDGKSSLTEVRKVEFGKAGSTVITIYPNPSDSRISIEAKNQDVSSISVRDLTGRQVALINNVKQNNQLTLSSGLYMVNAIDASGNILSSTKVTIR